MAEISENNGSSNDCVVQVEPLPPHGSGEECSYPRVLESLKNENTVAFYTPQVISFGPYHFQMKEPIFDDEVEVLKSEVARNFNAFAVMEKFKELENMKRMKKIYAKGFRAKSFPSSLSDDVLASMMTRDACFLVAILKTFSKEENIKGSSKRKEDHRLPSRYHPLMYDIVKDMFKMENQLPLWVLDEMRKPLAMSENDCFESAFKKLSPVEVKVDVEVLKEDRNRRHPESHILYLLHQYIVDTSPSPSSSTSTSTSPPPNQICLSSSPSPSSLPNSAGPSSTPPLRRPLLRSSGDPRPPRQIK